MLFRRGAVVDAHKKDALVDAFNRVSGRMVVLQL